MSEILCTFAAQNDANTILTHKILTIMKKIFLFFTALCCAVMVNAATAGALSGKFSVSATRQVVFSQGNLQYKAAPTPTWQFAENQWDAIGASNEYIAADYTGWIDLFGWGTGDNPTEYEFGGDYSTFTDWGTNAISNGGDAPNLWRTLSKEEWEYLLQTRSSELFALGSVNGVNGLIILPDNWEKPAGASFTPSTSQGLVFDTDEYINSSENNFSHNTYSIGQWETMETAGAVFLPAAGSRETKAISNVNNNGDYWTSTEWKNLYFTPKYLRASSHSGTRFGYAVRLVQDDPKVGDYFFVASGSNILKYQVISVAPDPFRARLLQYGHTLVDKSDLVLPAQVNYLGQDFAVTSIDNWPDFNYVKSLSIPKELTSIFPFSAFNDGDSIETFILDPTDPNFAVVDGVVYNKDLTKLIKCPSNHAFSTSDFPGTLTTLGWRSFIDCVKLDELDIPGTVTSLGDYTFASSSLRRISIPTSITSMSQGVFASCKKLEDVQFAKSAAVCISGWDAFNNAKIIKDQTGDFKVVDSIAIEYTGSASLVRMPDSIVNIAYSFIYYTDAGAANLDTIILPASLKTAEYTFLGSEQTHRFPNLTTVISRAPEPPLLWKPGSSDTLRLFSDQTIELIVPCGCKAAYDADPAWNCKTFSQIKEELIYEVTLAQTAGGTIAEVSKENCNEVKIQATPASGYKFVKWSDDSTDNPHTFTITADTEISAVFAEDSGTGIDTVTGNPSPVTEKVLRNGQLLIIHNGRTFNALGAEVK